MYSDDERNANGTYYENNVNGGNDNSSLKKIIIGIIVIFAIVLIYFLFFKKGENYVVSFVNNPEYVPINSTQEIGIKLNGNIYNGNKDDITWNSSDNAIASVNNNGVVTTYNYPGTVKITMSYNKKGKSSNSNGTIIVYRGEKNINVTDISFPSNELLLKSNDSFNLMNNFNVTPENGYIERIEFISSNPTVLSVDNKGTIQALSDGSSEITVTINNQLERKVNVIVSSDATTGFSGTIQGISFLDGQEVTVGVQEMKELNVSLTPENANRSDLTWKSSDNNIVTVDGTGKITGVSIGKAMITASSQSGVSASINVNVSNVQEIQKIEFTQTGIYVDVNNNPQLDLKKGDNFLLTPTITPSTALDKKLVFDVLDKTILSVVPSVDGETATITASKVGTTTITVKSSNNVTAVLTVNVKSNSSSTPSSGACYCNSALTSCVWGSRDEDRTYKQSQIPNANACSIYASGPLCFKDSSGKYNYGRYGSNPAYTYVAGAANKDACEALNSGGNTQSASLSCGSAIVKGTGTCRLSTNVSPYTLSSAKSSNTDIATVVIGGNVATVTCKNKGNVTITAKPANGLDEVSAPFECKDERSFTLTMICPSKVSINNSVYISGTSKIKCSSNNAKVDVASLTDGRCRVTGSEKGESTITVTSVENSDIQKTCKVKVEDEYPKDAKINCTNAKYTGSYEEIATCTNCNIDGNQKAKNRGTYTVRATAKDGHLFANGTNKATTDCKVE